ncbi:MAG: antitoxin [Verrucomicrobia bacterium]|nr:antitoxin [Verrucomicrobiota bacterium]
MSEPESAARAALAAVIQKDVATVERLTESLQALPAEASYSDAAGQGYALHNIYCALENSFDQISRTFENHVVDRSQWHRELMSKMFLAIPGVRPSVLPESLQSALNDLRSFRHLFRHGYDFQLDPVRLNALAEQWRTARPAVLAALSDFAGWLIRATGTK